MAYGFTRARTRLAGRLSCRAARLCGLQGKMNVNPHLPPSAQEWLTVSLVLVLVFVVVSLVLVEVIVVVSEVLEDVLVVCIWQAKSQLSQRANPR